MPMRNVFGRGFDSRRLHQLLLIISKIYKLKKEIVPKNVPIFAHFQTFSLISENYPATLYLSTLLQSIRVNLDFNNGQPNG